MMTMKKFFDDKLKEEIRKLKRLRVLKNLFGKKQDEFDYEEYLTESEKIIETMTKEEIIRQFTTESDRVLFYITETARWR